MKLKARIRPHSRGHDEIDIVNLELMNPDGSPYEGGGEGGGGGGGGGVAGQVIQTTSGVSLSPGVNGGAVLWGNEPSINAVGIDLSEYADANEVLLPQGVYVSRFESYFDPGVDEGSEDQDRSVHLNLSGGPVDWPGLREYGFDMEVIKADTGWADSNVLVRKVFPFVIWADHQTAQIYVTASATAPVDFTVLFMIAKIADLPES